MRILGRRVLEPGRVRHLYDFVAESLQRNAHIQLHHGKTRVWNNVDSLEREVWQTDGIKVLGTPLRTLSSWPSTRRSGSRKNNGCGMRSRLFQICSTHSKLWFRAPIQKPTTTSERCLLVCPKSTLVATTRACGPRPRVF